MIWDTFMFKDEFAMLEMRIEAFGVQPQLVTHVAVEAPWTHRGVGKPRHLRRAMLDGGVWADVTGLVVLDDDQDPDPRAPWVNEHHQRNRAWAYIDSLAADDDWVLICDVDEIPSQDLLGGLPGIVCSVPMRTFLFAVDWEVAQQVPPACVAARVSWLRDQARSGCYLAEVRDRRDAYPVFGGFGGWHFSWCGGPAAQAEKLETATCHTEILGTEEAALIRSGERWAAAHDGGGLPVRPVDVDGTWPAYIRERRCPVIWFRPRSGVDSMVFTAGGSDVRDTDSGVERRPRYPSDTTGGPRNLSGAAGRD